MLQEQHLLIPRKAPRRRIRDTVAWVDCWTAYTRVVVSTDPGHAAELLSYQDVVLRTYRSFARTDVWLRYDRNFRRKAACSPVKLETASAATATASFSVALPVLPGTTAPSPAPVPPRSVCSSVIKVGLLTPAVSPPRSEPSASPSSCSKDVHVRPYPSASDRRHSQSPTGPDAAGPSAPRRATSALPAPSLPCVSSPVSVSVLADELRDHPDESLRQFLISGFTYGFRFAFRPNRVPRLRSASVNMGSALRNPQVVYDYLAREVHLGRVVGPFPTWPSTNRGTIPVTVSGLARPQQLTPPASRTPLLGPSVAGLATPI